MRRGPALVSVLVLLVLLVSSAVASAAELNVTVTPREAFVGKPVTLTIEILNARRHDEPPTPRIPGAVVRFDGRSDRTNFINGRTSTSVTYTWRVVPREVGRLTIPALAVQADGRELTSQPVDVVVIDPGDLPETDTKDLVYTAITSPRTDVYVGEALELTLQIWIRVYRDRRYDVTLDESNTWTLVNEDISSWGIFQEALDDLAARRRRPAGREVLRTDESGNERAYMLYRLPVTTWPDTSGPLDIGGVALNVTYPTALRRQRDIFRDNWTIASSIRVLAKPEIPAVTVRDVPRKSRPPFYAGAVGRFDIHATARPREVAVGDPITLDITVSQVGRGVGRLEGLSPPPLARLPELTEHFRLPADRLTGVVEGRRKRFTQTLRATSADVTRIPAIPFAFFDPENEQFVTVTTDPIDIAVSAASSVAMSDIVGATEPGVGNGDTDLTEVAGGLLANYTDVPGLLADQRLRLAWWHAALLALPPAAWLGTLVTRRRVSRLRTDRGYARRRQARRVAMQNIARARKSQPGEQAELIATAVRGYVADRCDLPAGAVTRQELVQGLESGGVDREVIDELEMLLRECETQQYAAGADGNGTDLARRAEAGIQRLERIRL